MDLEMSRDKVFMSTIITLVGWPFGEGYTWIMKQLGFTNLTAFEALSMMWMKEPSWILGILAAFGFNYWLSLAIYYSARIWGTDYFPYKAMLLTMTAESILFNTFGRLADNPLMIQSTAGNYVHASAAAIGGIVSGFLIRKYVLNSDSKKSS
ncbi:MAG TPA: hypothetical protein PL004_00910 [Bacillota bacterium]|nr:hypothetical protein [Bacillota bacterium]